MFAALMFMEQTDMLM
jgi:hypothetical protein